MENQKGSNDGKIDGLESRGREVMVANQRTTGTCESLLRILALALTLAAAIVLGVNKQSKVVPIKLVEGLPPLNVSVPAKWHYLSAFVYFVVVNAVASAYAAVSLVLSLANRGGKSSSSSSRLVVIFLDVIMVSLLFSSIGAAGAIGLMGREGNKHVQWKKVCNTFGKFCGQAAVAVILSLLGSIAFVLLVMLSARSLHKKITK
ncbi:hypothetical protein FEM48_Zijuj12G0183900 [Ziziphus jujuba var. spinosa]|uniref:CASP-like protein n=1 Tax=Ziziphus jujuba var. spinosa TaxID=714518 RepID=A0A978UEU1_ZIZJJ|nr:hypothetical protein FEM48_Zijuj12G0183900 [Ziziphus jujuba var. spinosa]